MHSVDQRIYGSLIINFLKIFLNCIVIYILPWGFIGEIFPFIHSFIHLIHPSKIK